MLVKIIGINIKKIKQKIMRKITSASNEICDLSLLEGDRSQILLLPLAISGSGAISFYCLF